MILPLQRRRRGAMVIYSFRSLGKTSYVRHSSESWNPVPWLPNGLESLDPSFRWDDEQKAGLFEVPFRRLRIGRGHRHQPQVLEVETEIGQRRDRLHAHFADMAVHVQRKVDEGVGIQRAVVPAHGEAVVLPWRQRADQLLGLAEAQAQPAVLAGDHDIAV